MAQSNTRLVGRDAELALLGRMLEGVVAGRGGAVLVEGEAGIGKSALLEAGLAGAAAIGCQVFHGSCDELTQHFPLSVVLETLGVRESSADERRAELARSLAGPSDGSTLGLRLAAGDPVMAAVEQLVALVDRLCADGPMVLVLEDLHWADEAALVLWWRLLRACRQLPLLVVGSCRPWPVPRELGRLRGELREPTGTVISLQGLSGVGVQRLVRNRFGCPPGDRLAGFLESAAGNPLYVRELLDALARSRALDVVADQVELTKAQDWSRAVWSLSEVANDRLSLLSPGTGEVLRMAALLGAAFSVEDLSVAVGRDRVAVVDAVREAIDSGVLEGDGARLRFRHPLLREVLYQGLALPVRTTLHRQVFEAFLASDATAERVAESLLPVLEAADGWELDWIVDHAGALANRAPQVAADLLQHAVDRLPPDDSRRRRAVGTLIPLYVYLRRFEQVDRTARELLAYRDLDPEQAGQAWWFLARNHLQTGRPGAAVEAVTQALASDRLTPLWRARLAATRAAGLGMTRRTEEARREAQATRMVGEQLSDALTQGYALHVLACLATITDDMEAAADYADQAADKLRGDDHKFTDLAMLVEGNRCFLLLDRDQFDRAEQAGQRLLALAEHTWTSRLSSIRLRLAESAYLRGRWDDADAQLELVDEMPTAAQNAAISHAFRAAIAARRNDWDQALPHLNAIADLDSDGTLALVASHVLVAWALRAERSGSPDQVIEALAPCLNTADGLHLADQNMLLPNLVRAGLALGDQTTLQTVRDFYSTPAPGTRPPRHLAGRRWVQGLLTDDPTPVLAAADYFREAGRLAWLGTALEDAAVLQAAQGDTESARSTVTEALEVYGTMGAVWDARRAAGRIRAHGVRQGVRASRRRPRYGWAALSDTETRIATMVAQGLSNPDIAQQLVLSRRTVETHVSHILGKLQIHSRRDVTAH